MTRPLPTRFGISAYQVLRHLYTVNFTCDDFMLKYALSTSQGTSARWFIVQSANLGLLGEQGIRHETLADTPLVRLLNSVYGLDVLRATLWACDFETAAEPITRAALQAVSVQPGEMEQSWATFIDSEVANSPFWPAGKVSLTSV